MTIDDLIIKLYEIKQEHGNLDILQWNDECGRLLEVDNDRFFCFVTKPEKKVSRAEAMANGTVPVYPDWPLSDTLDPSNFTDKVVVL